jgi:DNA helicase-2/ATP-dependent DNA helicase PcrA
LNEIAIIYRKNEIAGHFQKKLHELKIPFVIYGGKGLFKTDEVKIIICYLQMLLKDNDFAFKRTVSMPPRGIGTKRLEKLNYIQSQKKCSLFDALKTSYDEENFKNTGAIEYISVIEELRKDIDNIPISSLILKLVDKINLKEYFSNGEESGLENIFEFIRVVEDIEENNIIEKQPTLRLVDFLDSIATLDENSKKSDEALKLMSAHAAKGLEFNHVFVCGLEEGTFPLSCKNEEMFFEERRLFFVALTRAKVKLYLSGSQCLKEDVDASSVNVSRFVSEIRNTINTI